MTYSDHHLHQELHLSLVVFLRQLNSYGIYFTKQRELHYLEDILHYWRELLLQGDESVGLRAPSGDQIFQVSMVARQEADFCADN